MLCALLLAAAAAQRCLAINTNFTASPSPNYSDSSQEENHLERELERELNIIGPDPVTSTHTPVPLETQSDLEKLKRSEGLFHYGPKIGTCPQGFCCTQKGLCSPARAACEEPGCQEQYSNGRCDGSALKPEGESTLGIPRKLVGDIPYNRYIYKCFKPGTIALTFEDGPYIYTEKILQLLDEHNAKATFFITGNNLGKTPIDDPSTPWPSLLKLIHESGHQLGSHGWSHKNLVLANDHEREQELVYNEMAFRNVLGFFPRYLRPPYGACSRDSGCMDYVANLGYRVIDWSVDLADTSNNTWEYIQGSKRLFDYEVSIDHTVGNYIVRMHDTFYQTAYNLTSYVLDKLEERGYYVVTVGDCIGDPKQNWYIEAGNKTATETESF